MHACIRTAFRGANLILSGPNATTVFGNELYPRDASQAYIRSQAHAGWRLIKSRYNDGGFSGGSTDRPALQQLLADVKARKIDVIVVIKSTG